ncbi:MAG: hypothetical protein AAFY56_17175 [Pseudomonadota bacterium]
MSERGVGSSFSKISLHGSGKCRWADTKERKDGRDRATLKWERKLQVDSELGRTERLADLAFPTNHLSTNYEQEIPKGTLFIPPAPTKQATLVQVLNTKLKQETDCPKILCQSHSIIGQFQSANGSVFLLKWAHVECGSISIEIPAEPRPGGAVFGRSVFPDFDSTFSGRPMRLVIPVGEKGILPTIYELGGYEAETPSAGREWRYVGGIDRKRGYSVERNSR